MQRSREEMFTAVCVNPLSQAFSKQPTLALPSSSLPALVLLMELSGDCCAPAPTSQGGRTIPGGQERDEHRPLTIYTMTIFRAEINFTSILSQSGVSNVETKRPRVKSEKTSILL